MKDDQKKLKKKYDEYLKRKDEIKDLKAGIKLTGDVWNKYVEYIESLIARDKINDQTRKMLRNKISILNEHWQDFKEAWEFKASKSHDYGLFPDQRYNLDKLLP